MLIIPDYLFQSSSSYPYFWPCAERKLLASNVQVISDQQIIINEFVSRQVYYTSGLEPNNTGLVNDNVNKMI